MWGKIKSKKKKEKEITYEYSNNEIGARRNDGQVKLERSPVKEANVLRKEEKLPCWSAGMLSSADASAVVIVFAYMKIEI